MKRKTDPRFTDTRVIKGSGNVFIDLGFDDAEAEVMALRVELMARLREWVTKEGLTQAEAARKLQGRSRACRRMAGLQRQHAADPGRTRWTPSKGAAGDVRIQLAFLATW